MDRPSKQRDRSSLAARKPRCSGVRRRVCTRGLLQASAPAPSAPSCPGGGPLRYALDAAGAWASASRVWAGRRRLSPRRSEASWSWAPAPRSTV